MKSHRLWANLRNKGSKKIRTWRIGDGDDWVLMDLPGEAYFEEVKSNYELHFGLDNLGKFYVWGKDVNEVFPKLEDSEQPDCFEVRHDEQPSHLKWLTDRNLKVLDF